MVKAESHVQATNHLPPTPQAFFEVKLATDIISTISCAVALRYSKGVLYALQYLPSNWTAFHFSPAGSGSCFAFESLGL
jgi:hypothetical protein